MFLCHYYLWRWLYYNIFFKNSHVNVGRLTCWASPACCGCPAQPGRSCWLCWWRQRPHAVPRCTPLCASLDPLQEHCSPRFGLCLEQILYVISYWHLFVRTSHSHIHIPLVYQRYDCSVSGFTELFFCIHFVKLFRYDTSLCKKSLYSCVFYIRHITNFCEIYPYQNCDTFVKYNTECIIFGVKCYFR